VHQLAVYKDNRVFVCDRENNRIQIFSPEGELLDIWTDGLLGPGDIHFQGNIAYVVEQSEGSGISIWDVSTGEVITRWRGIPEICEAVHGCAVDSNGNIFIAEIGMGDAGQRIRKLNKV
jgi:sugar lactone lactonase YvrE